ncbi:MAG: lipoyl synthase, partial [Bacteroidetes bacterium]
MIDLPVVSQEEKKKNKKPDWLRVKLPVGKEYANVRKIVDENKLHTICESGNCPNMGECWGAGTATFMILGNVCTRSCSFCAVATGRPPEYDEQEPQRVAEAIKKMGVKHAVLTSVNRDELKDRGAEIWYQTVVKTKELSPETTIETLIPDFKAEENLLQIIIDAKPDVISHNLETVRRLTKEIRVQAKYDRSLKALEFIASKGIRTKSGIMLGLGETEDEIYETMNDLLDVGCEIIT